MTAYSVAEAKNKLSELIERALKGEGVVITRHGSPVVELRAVRSAAEPITKAVIERLRARRTKPRAGLETPSESLAAIRDEDK